MGAFRIFTQNSKFREKNETLPAQTCFQTPKGVPTQTVKHLPLSLLREYKPTTTISFQQLTSAPICIKYMVMSFTWFLCLTAL